MHGVTEYGSDNYFNRLIIVGTGGAYHDVF